MAFMRVWGEITWKLDAGIEGHKEHKLIGRERGSGDVNPQSGSRVEDLTWKEEIGCINGARQHEHTWLLELVAGVGHWSWSLELVAGVGHWSW
jgi:hypothetical protein